MKNVELSDNICDEMGCLMTKDSSISMLSSTFSQNSGDGFIWYLEREPASLAFIESTEICIDGMTANNDQSSSFLSIANYTSTDSVTIRNAEIASSDLN